MKKIFAFILALASLSVACVFPTIGTFAMVHADTSMDHSSHVTHGDMESHMWMAMDWEEKSEDMHECCGSPFTDSFSRSNAWTSSWEDADLDNDNEEVWVALQEKLLQNNVHRLNSPPELLDDIEITIKDSYTSLVGIIKNNA